MYVYRDVTQGPVFISILYDYQKFPPKKNMKTTIVTMISRKPLSSLTLSNYIAFHVQKTVCCDKAFPPWQLGTVICLVSASSWPHAVASCVVAQGSLPAGDQKGSTKCRPSQSWISFGSVVQEGTAKSEIFADMPGGVVSKLGLLKLYFLLSIT